MGMEKDKGEGQEFQSAVSMGKMPVFEREKEGLLSQKDVVNCRAWAEHGDGDAG